MFDFDHKKKTKKNSKKEDNKKEKLQKKLDKACEQVEEISTEASKIFNEEQQLKINFKG